MLPKREVVAVNEFTLRIPDAVVDSIVERVTQQVLARLQSATARADSVYLNVEEAAELLRAKPQRIYDLVSAGRLTRFKDGSRVLVLRAEVQAHVAVGLRRSRRPPVAPA